MRCRLYPIEPGTVLVSRVRKALSTEGGDAPGWQGAKSENIGNI
jgi:hypothetical protein